MSQEATEKARRARSIVAVLLSGFVFVAFITRAVMFMNQMDPPVTYCKVDLPLLSSGNTSFLFARTEDLLDNWEGIENSVFGSLLDDPNIPDDEKHALEKTTPKEADMHCTASTYGTYPLKLLAEAWADHVGIGDVLVDLGSGNGYVLAAAALLTNASGRGIELSASRFQRSCAVLATLGTVLQNGGGFAEPSVVGSRRFEIWQGDLFSPFASLLAAPPNADSGKFVAFSYSNCFGDTFIERIIRHVAQVQYSRVELMISKLLKNETAIPDMGLRRIKHRGIHTYVKID